MANYHEEILLIATKTYPAPSKKYRETTCIAAINSEGEMRRLFPIPFRLLDGAQQFSRWEWIKARITKSSNDNRPESYKVDVDSIVRLRKVDTKHNWAERLQWIEPHLLQDFNQLEMQRQSSGKTLGFISPKSFSLEIQKADSVDWTEEEKIKLLQDGLFDAPDVKARIPLRKVPYDFYYKYTFENLPNVYRHKITDWEACALYMNCQRDYGNDWEKFFRQKLETGFSQKNKITFLMGTMHRFPDQWLIVGLLYPPKVEARMQPLFLTPPSE